MDSTLIKDMRKTINSELDIIENSENLDEIKDIVEILKVNIQKYADINYYKIKSKKRGK